VFSIYNGAGLHISSIADKYSLLYIIPNKFVEQPFIFLL
jgi:hypothetical protein